jgi:exodeoxyribonuclease V gamma subunit
MARRGALPAGHFADAVQAQLAEPMDDLFERYQEQLALWPRALPDALLDHLPTGADESLRLVDWLDGLRGQGDSDGAGPGSGQRARLLLDSGSLIRNKQYQRHRLVVPWVAHLAAQQGGQPLTTVIVSKAGTVTLQPLNMASAQAAWAALLQAWQTGLTRPLPLAVRSGFEWLDQGGREEGPDSLPAQEAARAVYENDDPQFGRFGERDGNAYLARAFPGFDALWSSGEFAHWALALLAPIDAAIQRAEGRGGKSRRGATGDEA